MQLALRGALRGGLRSRDLPAACAAFVLRARAFAAPARGPAGRPGQRLPPRGSGKPSSTDQGFTLDSLIGSSDDESLKKQLNSGPRKSAATDGRSSTRQEYSRGGDGVRGDFGSARPNRASPAPSRSDSARVDSATVEAPAPPSFLGIVDAAGDVVALESEDERHLPFVAPDDLSDSSRRRAVKQLGYYRRMLRATHSREDLEQYALALSRELGPDVMEDDFRSLTRPDDFGPAEDPLEASPLPFNVKAVSCKMHLTWGAPPGARNIDRRCVLTTTVRKLGLASREVADYVRTIAGSHYHSVSDTIKISIDHHPDAALNKREAMEQLVALVHRSNELVQRFGPMVHPPRFPPYED